MEVIVKLLFGPIAPSFAFLISNAGTQFQGKPFLRARGQISRGIHINSVRKFSALFSNSSGKCCFHFTIFFRFTFTAVPASFTYRSQKVNWLYQERKFPGTFAPGNKSSREPSFPGTPFPFGRICFVVLVMRKGGRAVEVVPGIYFVHWKFSMCTATRTSSYSPVGPSMFFVHI